MEARGQQTEARSMGATVRPLVERDVDAADRIMRLAFGTFLGLPDPFAFLGDASYVRARWQAVPSAAFAADVDGQLVGSNFATCWGSVGFFGPLTIHPDLWDQGLGKRLMEPIMDCLARWQTSHAGLFTFAQSPKHLGLYQRFGFWPRYLTAIMSKRVDPRQQAQWTRFSDIREQDHDEALNACHELTDAIYDGLDVAVEVRAVAEQGLGDTLLLWDDARLTGLAVCHYGPGTEAGSGACYIKFGVVRPSSKTAQDFGRLLDACEQMAAASGASRLVAGVNTARHEAYRHMLEHGFATDLQGVAMQRPNEPGYNRPGVYLIDDWR